MKRHLTSSQIIIGGFIVVIVIGTLLLMLPWATADGAGSSFGEALFTATSAVCVTGLVVQDTATYWSSFGQGIILVLIQIGGMGVVTFAVLIALISGRKIGLKQRSTLQEAIAAPSVGGIVELTGFIIRTTIVTELLGALLLFAAFYKDYGIGQGLWYAVFHSISAFCNAGFDLMGEREAFSSLTAYVGDVGVNCVIMTLIIIGGIGFMTWNDIRRNGMQIKAYRLQTKLILAMTGVLLGSSFLYFYFCEMSSGAWQELSQGEKALAALFCAVTPRTAGFNTIDLTNISETGQMVTILLMLTGGAPGSTAGGMKVTTIAVLILTMVSVFRRKEDVNCFGRRISQETLKHASAILLMYFIMFMLGGCVISLYEDIPILTCLFETASAIGTVGLTLGITPGLGQISRGILIGLMFFGRVGGLTLVFATLAGTKSNLAKMPKEKVTVG